MSQAERPATHVLDDAWGVLGGLSDRQRALVGARASAYALAHPGGVVALRVLVGAAGDRPVGIVEVRSLIAVPEATPSVPLERDVHLDVEGAVAVAVPPPSNPVRAAVERLGERSPVLGDTVRQALWSYGLRRADRRIRHRVPRPRPQQQLHPPSDAVPAALIGMYWLEPGGAESWALHTVRHAIDAGLHPVVVIDVPGAQRAITDPLLAAATIVDVHGLDAEEERLVLLGILAAWDVRGVWIHHSNWLYRSLETLRERAPAMPVVDTVHVVEWENGGFPMVAALHDELIDTHHVISTHLADYLTRVKGVAPTKVVVAPLVAMATRRFADAPVRRSDRPHGPMVLAHVGRLVPQKRPLLFVTAVHLARRVLPVTAIVHGDGPLLDSVRHAVDRRGLTGLVDFRDGTVPVQRTLEQADALLIVSQTEGLTLTTLEATTMGCIVVSSDVGGQRSVVAPAAHLSRYPIVLLAKLLVLLVRIRRSPALRRRMLVEQRARLARLAGLGDADVFAERTFAQWKGNEEHGAVRSG